MEVSVKEEPSENCSVESEVVSSSSTWDVYSPWCKVDRSNGEAGRSESCELKVPAFDVITANSTGDFVYDAKPSKARREVPTDKKDTAYWLKRHKNNESARRSRLKRRLIEQDMEKQLKDLQKENIELKYELAALKRHFKLDCNYDTSNSELGCDLSIRNGSTSDSSDSSSVVSDTENCSLPSELDYVRASQLSVLASLATRQQTASEQPRSFYHTLKTPFPFKYSFLAGTLASEADDISCGEQDADSYAKIPHKFRLKRDYHSAFCVPAESN